MNNLTISDNYAKEIKGHQTAQTQTDPPIGSYQQAAQDGEARVRG
jgi:hypothetical protein